jgi:hypothetical protein
MIRVEVITSRSPSAICERWAEELSVLERKDTEAVDGII